ncbi:AAHS family 3-hydroxyphenylpropionic acid transporter [Caulobacter ginsengisoli]|uniref:AAHS family 3-hydroxyphenylpropionic acid transporter n=1 Tax=Caulobacter ginsengisoli TaxID=400775 RepID=A0ABU0IRV4_9CAUL|nr:MFS transporter [Caulobacter ginsengisoli]MDQ0464739.1 AAHS family 3-hydroxyphenylpropionic acid transporter [Caulobacter ginsengisoli]
MQRPTASPALVIGLCLLASMLEGFDIQSMGVAGPSLAKALALSKSQMAWAFSASLFGLMGGAAGGGWLADRLGRRPVLIAATLIFGLFSLATAAAQTYPLLVAARVLTGLGLGGAMPMLIAIAAERASASRRTFMVTLIAAGMPLGGALVGLLARSSLGADWRMIFVVGGLAPIAIAPALWWWMPETLVKPAAADPPRQNALKVLFAPERLPTTLLLWIGYTATALVLHLFLNWLPTLLIARGFDKNEAALVSMLFNLGGAAGSLLIGLSIDRLGGRWPLTVVFLALAGVIQALAGATVGLAPTALMGFVAGGLLVGGQFGLYGIGPHYYALPVRGRGVGAAVAAGRLGSALGPLAAGQLLTAGASAGQVTAATVPIVLLAGLAALLLSFFGKPQD